jgi:hypothetical protein
MLSDQQKYPITAVAGDTFILDLTLYEDSAGVTPRNLTGYTADFIISELNQNREVLAIESGSGITLGGVAGTVQILLTPAQTTSLGNPSYAYQFKITSGTGVVTTILFGVLSSFKIGAL